MRQYLLCICAVMVVMLVWGAGVSFARGGNTATYYEDKEGNLCVGVGGLFAAGFPEAGNCQEWGAKTGKDNTGVGEKVMPGSTGSENVGVGDNALEKNETGSEDVAIGNQTLENTNTGSQDAAVGDKALSEDKTASDNTATGYFALLHDQVGGSNTATGDSADYRCGKGGGSECKENTETGASALRNNETGGGDAAFGYDALAWPEGDSGSEDVGVGYKAGSATNGGSNNVEIANKGVAGDVGIIRIGTESTQKHTYIAGIWEKEIAGPVCDVLINSSGELGCIDPPRGASSDASSAVFAQLTKMRAQAGRQQQEIVHLAGELQSLREQMDTHR